MGKNKMLDSVEIRESLTLDSNILRPGDEVFFVCDLWDPRINRGIVKKIYNTDPNSDSTNPAWIVKCTVEDACENIYRNVQLRRILKIKDAE